MRKMIKNAIITGVKTSNQLVLPVKIFMIKSTTENTSANESRICLKPILLPLTFLVLLFATGINYFKAISILLFLFLPEFVAFEAIGF
jgi:hypothetical protein